MVPFESLGAVSYSPSSITMLYLASFPRLSEILIDSRDFFIPHAFDAPVRGGGACLNIAIPFGVDKPEWCGYYRW